MNPLTYLPAKMRATFYGVYAVIGIVFGAIQAYLTATAQGVPDWLGGALAVYAYIGVALGITALSNISAETEPGPRALAQAGPAEADVVSDEYDPHIDGARNTMRE